MSNTYTSGANYTIAGMSQKDRGKYFISDEEYPTFLELFHHHCFEQNKKSSLLERHQSVAPILLDLDFKYESELPCRTITPSHYREFCQRFAAAFFRFFDHEELQFFVCQKPDAERNPSKGDDKRSKDGLHIVCPYLVTVPEIQFALRGYMLDTSGIHDVFYDTGYTNTDIDVYDYAVIRQNGWFLYGASKENKESYKLVATYTATADTFVDNDSSEWSSKELVQLLSIRNKEETTLVSNAQHTAEWEGLLKRWSGKEPTIQAPTPTRVRSVTTTNPHCIEHISVADTNPTDGVSMTGSKFTGLCDDDRLRPILLQIPSERWDNYMDWITIGMALFNEGCSVELWDEMSRNSDKYEEGACRIKWSSFQKRTDKKATVHTLKKWITPVIPKERIGVQYAAKAFAKLMGTHICRDGDSVYYFNNTTGLWGKSDIDFRDAVCRYSNELVFTEETSDGKILTHDYGTHDRNIHSFQKWVINVLPDTQYITKNIDNAIGKLLFADGIFDFVTGFTPGFTPSLVFLKRINRPFPKEQCEDTKRFMLDTFFMTPFNGGTAGLYLLKSITMALFGDYRRKRVIMCVGTTNCGKSKLTEALRASFGGYIGEFTANCLIYNERNGQDEAKLLAWMQDLEGCRLAMSNEIRKVKGDGQKIDGNLLKSIASGGDTMRVRRNNKDQHEFVNRATPFMLANDFPEIVPMDAASQCRIRCLQYKNRYSLEPSEGELQADPDLPNKINNPIYQNALFWVIADCYTSIHATREATIGGSIDECAEVSNFTKLMIRDEKEDVLQILGEKFEITNNPADTVPVRMIIAHLNSYGIVHSPTKIGLILNKAIQLPDDDETVRRSHGVRLRVGIKMRTV